MQEEPTSPLTSFLHPLTITPQTLSSLTKSFSPLYTHLALTSPSQFLATPINLLPHGTETGLFLAIDVGGSNLRVGFIELLGAGDGEQRKGKERIKRTYERSWSIEEHLKADNAEQLFRWIGGCIAEVVGDRWEDRGEKRNGHVSAEGEVVPLGITFSFPMIQSSIATATLMPMGKGFAITSNLGLGRLLLEGYSHHLTTTHTLPQIRIAAIANDSVATLASASYLLSSPTSNRRVAMGLIVATGSNATTTLPAAALSPAKTAPLIFPTSTSRIVNVAGAEDEDRIVVNTEWGINGTAPPLHDLGLVTRWDVLLDREASAPGFQPFEYMTGGRYVGELARIILVDYLCNVCAILMEHLPPRLLTRNALPTIFLSDKVARTRDPDVLLPLLQETFPLSPGSAWSWTLVAAQALLEIEEHVMRRSAQLTAAAVVGLLSCAGEVVLSGPADTRPTTAKEKTPVLVAYAGGVICQYPGYLRRCQEAVDQITENLAPGYKVVLEDAADGGLIGAAVLAATVWQLAETE